MAYGRTKQREHRMIDCGCGVMTPSLIDLRERCLLVVQRMSDAAFPERIESPLMSGQDLDDILSVIQQECSKIFREDPLNRFGLKAVWAEKMRLTAKAAVLEQWKRGQCNLFGRLKHIDTKGDKVMADGVYRLVNLPLEWSYRLSEAAISDLADRVKDLDFKEAMAFLNKLDDSGLTVNQVGALRALCDGVNERYGRPVWNDDAVIQLHLDSRCVLGRKDASRKTVLSEACSELTAAFKEVDSREKINDKTGRDKVVNRKGKDKSKNRGKNKGKVKEIPAAQASLRIASAAVKGEGIDVSFRVPSRIAERYRNGLNVNEEAGTAVTSLAIELGDVVRLRGVVSRPHPTSSLLGTRVVLSEDVGYRKTSTLVVARSKKGVTQGVLDFIDEKPGKRACEAYLSTHTSGLDVEVLERYQFDGKPFMDALKGYAKAIDTLRGEIDRCYGRLKRIREEINRVAGLDINAFVPPLPLYNGDEGIEEKRYVDMHGRFFRLLSGIERLKAKRRGVYRTVDGLKKSWFGHIGNIKVALAQKYDAVAVGEDYTVTAIEKDDPDYKGRVFNKMINNGALGHYIKRCISKFKWNQVSHIKIPSYYTSTTDWRTGCVNSDQRKGSKFTALDGCVWDADEHAAEMIARWLFLTPKKGVSM